MDVFASHTTPKNVINILTGAGCYDEGDPAMTVTVWNVSNWPVGLYPRVKRCFEAFHIALRNTTHAQAFLAGTEAGSAKARANVYENIAKSCQRQRQALERAALSQGSTLGDSPVATYLADLARGPLYHCTTNARAMMQETRVEL